MFVGWTGENQGALQRCKGFQLRTPVGTSAAETGNSVPFYINLILGCREEKAHLQSCLKTHLQIVGSGDDRGFQPKGDPKGAALKSQEWVAFCSKPTDKVPAFLPWHWATIYQFGCVLLKGWILLILETIFICLGMNYRSVWLCALLFWEKWACLNYS